MKKNLLLLVTILTLISCSKEKVDLIVINSNTYTVNTSFDKAEAFAIKDGVFIAVGKNEEITGRYQSDKIVDAENKTIVPGLIDAHCHFYRMGLQQQKVSLEGTKSYDEVLETLVAFQKEKNNTFITGRGWDQNDWELKEFPTKEKLDALFPKIPVAVGRVDGHALLVNQVAINMAGITKNTKVSGGEIILKNGKLTGVLIDAAMDFIKFPKTSNKEAIQGLLDAQKIAFSYGLTTVDDAGLDRKTIELIDSLQKAKSLKIRVYAMVSSKPLVRVKKKRNV